MFDDAPEAGRLADHFDDFAGMNDAWTPRSSAPNSCCYVARLWVTFPISLVSIRMTVMTT